MSAPKNRTMRSRKSVRSESSRRSLSRRLRVEGLEQRRLLAVVTVDTVADDNDPSTTSLRDAIALVNATPVSESNEILFDIPAAQEDPVIGRFVIQPTTVLPTIQRSVFIDGIDQVATNYPPIQIDGQLLTGGKDGLRVTSGDFSIDSIAVANFPGDGIETVGISNPLIEAVTIFGNGRNGVRLNNTTGGEVLFSDIYGNGAAGVQVTGSSVSNSVTNSSIGIYYDGLLGQMVTDGNATSGIQLLSPDNTISGNTISGNGTNGVSVSNPTAGGNEFTGNLIGTDSTGSTAIPNGSYGILIRSSGNIIGDSASIFKNVISGNARSGVVISGAAATGNQIANNMIGADIFGEAAIPNGAYGVLITGATINTVGGTNINDRNVISGNSAAGITLSGGSSNNTVQGNYVGLDVSGFAALPNNSNGVYLRANANNNEIADNFIAGNTGSQISLVAAGTTANDIHGNYIGFGKDFTEIAGGSVGILVKAPGNTIGGPSGLDANYITGSNTGISLSGTSANNTLIEGNVIGTDAAFPGSDHGMVNGVQIVQGAHDNTLIANTIAYNTSDAVRISSTGGVNNEITQNSMYGNGFGIDLGPNGFNANDTADADEGANRLQNSGFALVADGFFLSATSVQVNLSYSIDTAPANADYPLTVEFFLSDSLGQGSQHVSTDTFTAADFANGSANHTEIIDLNTLMFAADFGTATVTDASGNTSEFTPAVPIDIALPVAFAAAPTPPAALDAMDVNADNIVSARDALMVINSLAANDVSGESATLSGRGDVNGDGIVSARDALAIINRLARDRVEATDDLFSDDDDVDAILNGDLELTLF